MVPPLLLVGLAVLVATVGSGLLARASWPERSPRLGILTWQAISWSTVTAIVLAGVALAVPSLPLTGNLAVLVSACAAALRDQYATPAGAALGAAGAVMALAVIARVGYTLCRCAVTAARERRRQVAALAVSTRPHDAKDAVVLDHASPAAYCLPGRRWRIVVTTGALAALDEDQLGAVLDHERAHLRGRHHLVVGAAAALHGAFPRIPVFGRALAAQRRLVEMLADDQASRGRERITVATALVRLAEASAPVAALGAGGGTALARVARLASPQAPLTAPVVALGGVCAAALMLAPVIVVAVPAVMFTATGLCPLGASLQGLCVI